MGYVHREERQRKNGTSIIVHWQSHHTRPDPKDPTKVKRIRTGGSKSFYGPMAEKQARRFELQKEQALDGDPLERQIKKLKEGGAMSLRELVTVYRKELAGKRKEAKTVAYIDEPAVAALEAIVKRKSINLIERDDFKAWVSAQEGELAGTTLNIRGRSLRALFNAAKREGWILENPVRSEDIPDPDGEPRRRFPKKLVRDFLKWMRKDYAELMGAFDVIRETGVRIGEVEPGILDWRLIFRDPRGRAFVNLNPAEVPIKGRRRARAKAILLSPAALRAMGTPKEEGPVFPAFTRTKLYVAMHDISAKLGISPPATPHEFRHTKASEVAETVSSAELMSRFGWKDPKTAMSYTHIIEAKYQDAEGREHGGLRHISSTMQKPRKRAASGAS